MIIFTRCGTAIPTNDIGPANAVTHADKRLDNNMRSIRSIWTFTPILRAYASPSWYALIGFERKNVAVTVITTITLITFILSQLIPEKLPIDQLCRFTIFESLANVTQKSVIAEHIYPIIIPQTTSIDIFLILNDMTRTNAIASSEPVNAAITIPSELIIIPFSSKKIITSATTSFAPEEIPSTYGPAIGFWKKL